MTTGPNTGSRKTPQTASIPPRSCGATRKPRTLALGRRSRTRASIARAACAAASGDARPTTTPPTSVLWAMSGESIFSTVGPFTHCAARATSASSAAKCSASMGTPAEASSFFAPSSSRSEIWSAFNGVSSARTPVSRSTTPRAKCSENCASAAIARTARLTSSNTTKPASWNRWMVFCGARKDSTSRQSGRAARAASATPNKRSA